MPTRNYTAFAAAEFLQDGPPLLESSSVAVASDFLFGSAGEGHPRHRHGRFAFPTAFEEDAEAEKEAAEAQAEAEKKDEKKPPRPPKFASTGPSPPESWSSQMMMDTVTSGRGRAANRAKDLHQIEEKTFGIVLTLFAFLLMGGSVFGEHVYAFYVRRQKAKMESIKEHDTASERDNDSAKGRGSKKGSGAGSKGGSDSGGSEGRSAGRSIPPGSQPGSGAASQRSGADNKNPDLV